MCKQYHIIHQSLPFTIGSYVFLNSVPPLGLGGFCLFHSPYFLWYIIPEMLMYSLFYAPRNWKNNYASVSGAVVSTMDSGSLGSKLVFGEDSSCQEVLRT